MSLVLDPLVLDLIAQLLDLELVDLELLMNDVQLTEFAFVNDLFQVKSVQKVVKVLVFAVELLVHRQLTAAFNVQLLLRWRDWKGLLNLVRRDGFQIWWQNQVVLAKLVKFVEHLLCLFIGLVMLLEWKHGLFFCLDILQRNLGSIVVLDHLNQHFVELGVLNLYRLWVGILTDQNRKWKTNTELA